MGTTGLVYLGLFLLSLLSFQDFRNKIMKRGRNGQYYTCLLFFVLLNGLIYIAVCSIILGPDMAKLLSGQVPNNLPLEKKALPLLLAFAYFGVGSANISLGDKAVSIYGALLKMFQGMYKPEDIPIDPIRIEIDRLNSQSDTLQGAVEKFNATGQDLGWNILAEQWKDLTQDQEALESHRQSLQFVQEELRVIEPLDTNTIHKINKGLDEKIGQITTNINQRLRRHIFALVVANGKNPSALQEILTAVGLNLPAVPPPPGNMALYRAIVFSLFGGALLGSVSTYFTTGQTVQQMWSWMLALGVFGTIFSFIARLTISGSVWALALGAVAGAAGHLTMNVVGILLDDAQHIKNNLPPTLVKTLIGAVFGASLAWLTHVFRFYVRPRIHTCFLCYALKGIAGAALFTVLGVVIPLETKFALLDKVLFFAIIGFAVAIIAALITNIFHENA